MHLSAQCFWSRSVSIDWFDRSHRVKLCHAPLVPAPIETCFQPDPYNLEREILGNHALSDRENVRVIMLAGKPGRFFIPAKRTTHAMNLVRYHRFAVARAAEHNATFTFGACHCLRDWA